MKTTIRLLCLVLLCALLAGGLTLPARAEATEFTLKFSYIIHNPDYDSIYDDHILCTVRSCKYLAKIGEPISLKFILSRLRLAPSDLSDFFIQQVYVSNGAYFTRNYLVPDPSDYELIPLHAFSTSEWIRVLTADSYSFGEYEITVTCTIDPNLYCEIYNGPHQYNQDGWCVCNEWNGLVEDGPDIEELYMGMLEEWNQTISEPHYYIFGSMNNSNLDDAYFLYPTNTIGMLASNPITLSTSDFFAITANNEDQAVSIYPSVNVDYYGNETIEYIRDIPADGTYRILFRPDRKGGAGWYGGCIRLLPVSDSLSYAVSVADGIQHGTVTASSGTARWGDTVTLTVTPDTGYSLDSLSYTDANGYAIKFDGASFTMPCANVTVHAEFIEESLAVPSGYYLVGTMTSGMVQGAYALSASRDTTGMYVSAPLALSPGDTFTISYKDENGVFSDFMPEGTEPFSGIPADGLYQILFRPDGRGGESWYGGCVKAVPYPCGEAFSISLPAGVEHGALTPTAAQWGDTVTLTFLPEEGYAPYLISVTDAYGNSIETTDGTFTMPYADVTVNAGFLLMQGFDLSQLVSDFTVPDGATLTGQLNGSYQVSLADGATVTLNGVTINGGRTSKETLWAGLTCLGDATIILAEGSENIVQAFGYQNPGIYVSQNHTLTIKGSGALTAIGGAGVPTGNDKDSQMDGGAGIGGGDGISCGNIVISGGSISATGGEYSPGIGSGRRGSCGSITITGGVVTANGYKNAAGIGTAWGGNCGDISITGGSVAATGGFVAVGVGSGFYGTCGNITISGGSITATGGFDAVGVGSGFYGTCGNITISGGSVSAIGSGDATGIGCGCDAFCGSVTITGGIVTAVGSSGAADIGKGKQGTFFSNYSVGTIGVITIAGTVFPDGCSRPSGSDALTVACCTVQFNANGGAGAMESQTYWLGLEHYGITQALPANAFTHASLPFACWTTALDGSGLYLTDSEDPGCLVSLAKETVTLYALWGDRAISFDPNGGTGVMEGGTAAPGQPYELPACAFAPPVGMIFDHWEVAWETGEKQPGDSFTVPSLPIAAVTACWTPIDYAITVSDSLTAWTVTPQLNGENIQTAHIDDMVTFRVTPPSGYVPSSFTYVPAGGEPVTVTADPDTGTLSLLMPAADVTVTAFTFQPDPAHFSVNDAGTAYTIHTAAGWGLFCDCLLDSAYHGFSGKTVFLEADISVSAMAGLTDQPFQGVFDGQGHTLTFSCTAQDNYTAPFCLVQGTSSAHAAIRNLSVHTTISGNDRRHLSGLIAMTRGFVDVTGCSAYVNISSVKGSANTTLYPAGLVSHCGVEDNSTLNITGCSVTGEIATDGKFAGGFIGIAQGNVSIADSVCGVSMKSAIGGDGSHGSFVGLVSGGSTAISGCVFDGRLLSAGSSPTTHCGGFAGWVTEDSGFSITHSLFAPAEVSFDGTQCATFARNRDAGEGCYYTQALGAVQGKAMGSLLLPEGVTASVLSGKAYTQSGKTWYYPGAAVAFISTYTPPAGLALAGYTCAPEGGQAVTVADGSYTMPGAQVTVEIILQGSYLNENGVLSTHAPMTILTGDETEWTGWYAAVDNLTISGRPSVSGEAHLILCDGAQLTIPKGIEVASGNSLTIYAQSAGGDMGKLLINGVEVSSAGIGGGNGCACGPITINGGVINVTGGNYGAGIGSGSCGAADSITINGGSVTANGGYYAAGIGGGGNSSWAGSYGSAGTVTINGGTVAAKGSNNAAGIGGGGRTTFDSSVLGGSYEAIIIRGGQVTATSSTGAGIGPGPGGTAGAVTLSWTRNSDCITAKSFVAGSIVLEKTFHCYNGDTDGGEATAENLPAMAAGQTLRPWPRILFAGQGTQASPYLIQSEGDWNALGELVKAQSLTSGTHFLLAQSISVSRPLGDNQHAFTGVFDGGGNTLNVNIRMPSVANTAPFPRIMSATIRNLRVTGVIVGGIHSSGLVGGLDGGSSLFRNVEVAASVSIESTSGYYMSGFLGHGGTAALTMEGCVFSGSMSSPGDYAGGLYGWSDGGSLTLKNCLFTGSYSGAASFHPIAVKYRRASVNTTIENAYYNPAAAPTFTDAAFIAAAGAPAYTVTSSPDVTMGFGQGTSYSVSGLTAYAGALSFGGAYRAGAGAQVTMSLGSGLPDSLIPLGYEASAGTLTRTEAGWTLTMPAENVVIGVVTAPAFGAADFTLPGGLTEIGEEAFAGADMTAVWIPDTCASIGDRAFQGCASLTQIRVPASCVLGDNVFDGCGTVYVYSAPGSSAQACCESLDNLIFVDESLN